MEIIFKTIVPDSFDSKLWEGRCKAVLLTFISIVSGTVPGKWYISNTYLFEKGRGRAGERQRKGNEERERRQGGNKKGRGINFTCKPLLKSV